jgi:excinuclease ABC subunit A
MKIELQGASEHNLKNIDVELDEAVTVVTGVSGSGKSSLVLDTLYHEARRRFLEIYSLGSVADRLAPAKVRNISGLRPAVAVGQDLLNRNPNSTVATASGLHPLLRLLYARFGQRSCQNCGQHLSLLSEDDITARLMALASSGPIAVKAPLVRGASGSHRTLLAHLIDTFGPAALTIDGRTLAPEAIGQGEILTLDPVDPHTIDVEIARCEEPITAAVANQILEVAKSMGTWAVQVEHDDRSHLFSLAALCTQCGTPFEDLEPSDFNRSCQQCQGQGCLLCRDTGLSQKAAAVSWMGRHLGELLTLSVAEAGRLFATEKILDTSVTLREEIVKRLVSLNEMGLGYIALDRPAPTLSRGEGQRLRLAVALVSQLEDMLYVLDEPTIGQHPADVARLLPALRRLKGQVVFVEHDRQAAAGANRVIDLGPGAGAEGGQVVYTGSPSGLWAADTATGHYFSLRERVHLPETRPQPQQFLTLHGAHRRNLDHVDVPIPVGRLTVVSGVSGSGKSTLVEDVLVASLQAGSPVGCQSVAGPVLKPVLVDQKPIGKNPRSNPATYTKLSDIVRDHFSSVSSLTASHYSFNRPEGACPACQGMGAIEIRMRYLPSTWITCATCGGRRFSDEVLGVEVEIGGRRLSIADFYQLSIGETLNLIQQSGSLASASRRKALRMLRALMDVGLGYLTLGQPSPSLSGGEAQRLKLARVLGGRALTSQLLVLDEPTTGLHPQDVAGLLVILDRIVRTGATIVVVEHNADMILAADWVIELGPGAGPSGGRLLFAGPVAGLNGVEDSPTAAALKTQEAIHPQDGLDSRPVSRAPLIRISKARAHNLKDVDVDIPKAALTVVTGLSGSGKSSLINDVLEAEARRQFMESLSMYERQGSRPGPEASADQVTGAGVTLSVKSERRLFDRRATVGTATEMAHHLAVILAWTGRRRCLKCGQFMRSVGSAGSGLQWECTACQITAEADARHFSPLHYAAACLGCNGVGTLQEPNPAKLIIRPDKPLCAGAMYSPGFFPKGYLCKPFNGGYDMVQALASRYEFDPFETPWNRMSDEAQEAFLYGDPRPMDIHFRSRNQSYIRRQGFPGFYGFIRDWDVGGTYTDTISCPECGGARLRPEFLTTTLAGHHFHSLCEMDLERLAQTLGQAEMTQPNDERLGRPADLIEASQKTLSRRLHFLGQVGLDYLSLNRLTATLSAGEAQRIRLAALLGGQMSGLTILLDEPSRGLHPSEVEALLAALRELREQGNCVIVIEHDLAIVRAADHLIEVGPGAGVNGGSIVAQGMPSDVARSGAITGAWLRQERRFAPRRARDRPADWLTILGAQANNLVGQTVDFPRRRLVGVCGVSGSGKSTLVVDTLGRALAPKKHTTSVASEPLEPGRHERIEGAPARTIVVDQAHSGVTSPASFLRLDGPLRKVFAESEQGRESGLTLSDFKRDCSGCKGRGTNKINLGFLPPIRSLCEMCHGTGYGPRAQQVRLAGVTLPELTLLTIAQLHNVVEGHEAFDRSDIRRPIEAALEVGLGYLALRQPGHALSGGEAQRLKIARELCRKSGGETLYILDEPSLGQHMEDLRRLVGLLGRLVDDRNSVVIVEHEVHILAACDWLVELGPGGGPAGGRVIFAGPPGQLAAGATPLAPYLKAALDDKEDEAS